MNTYEICAIIGTVVWVGIGWYVIKCFRHLAGIGANMQEITQKINNDTMERIGRHLDATESILVQVEQETVPAVSSAAQHVSGTLGQVEEIADSLAALSNIPVSLGKGIGRAVLSWFKK